MQFSFKDGKHLFSLLFILFGAIGVFVMLRASVVPAGFGQYGHYRAGAIDNNRNRPISFAGQATCLDCHDQQAKERVAGKHAQVSCEACHGAQGKHVETDGGNKPGPIAVNQLCLTCHEKDAARPKWFPQVVKADHGMDSKCNDCHTPHKPKM